MKVIALPAKWIPRCPAHRETHAVRSRGFRRWLVAAYYGLAHRPPSAQPLADALGALEARAQMNGELRDVHVRLAEHDGAIYLDLADDEWRVVEITPTGWRVLDVHDDIPVRFRRARGVLALPEPERGGSLVALRKHVNVRDDERSETRQAHDVLTCAAVRTGTHAESECHRSEASSGTKRM